MTRRSRRWALTIACLAAGAWVLWWLYQYMSSGAWIPNP